MYLYCFPSKCLMCIKLSLSGLRREITQIFKKFVMNDWLFSFFCFYKSLPGCFTLGKGVNFDGRRRESKSSKTSWGLKSHVMKTESCYIIYNILHFSAQINVFIIFRNSSSQSNVVYTPNSNCSVDPVEQGHKKSILHVCILLISSASL